MYKPVSSTANPTCQNQLPDVLQTNGFWKQLECGPMPDVMATQPNTGGTLCDSFVIPFLVPRHKLWLNAAAQVPCSHTVNTGERKTWTQSEFLQLVKFR